jgi:hypothetical protein
MKNIVCYFIGMVVLVVGSGSAALAADKQLVFEDENIKLQLFPRSPNQMAGFYEARGFPKEMVKVLSGFCFMTVVIHNKTKDVFWLDLDNWKFTPDSGEIQRVHRKQWPPRWKKMSIPMASQSTFRWTLLPEAIEFFPDEHEGGNMVFVSTKNSFLLQASFDAGKNKEKGRIVARINNVQCAENIPEKGSNQ